MLCSFPRPPPLKMRRFLKKLKRSRNPVPPENPAHQTTDPGAERDGESESEYRSRKISVLMGPMGLIRP